MSEKKGYKQIEEHKTNVRIGLLGKRQKDITGQKFGRWTAINFSHRKNGFTYWVFKCICGTERTIRKGNVVCEKGSSKSCGCLKKENRRNTFLGKNNPRWNGGISPFIGTVRALEFYKKWRVEVLKKDNYTCQICKIRGGHNLEVDHIKPFSLILKENKIDTLEKAMNCSDLWDINNGRVLCSNCHKNTPTYKGRMYNILNKAYGKV